MVLRRLLFTLLSNPRLIERLSESRPIRAAAQLTAAALTRAHLRRGDLARRAARLRETFLRELRDGARDWPRPPGTKRDGSGSGSGSPGARREPET